MGRARTLAWEWAGGCWISGVAFGATGGASEGSGAAMRPDWATGLSGHWLVWWGTKESYVVREAHVVTVEAQCDHIWVNRF